MRFVRPPRCSPILGLDALVEEEAANKVERRLGEVLLVGRVLLHAADEDKVRLLPQLVEPQRVCNPGAAPILVNVMEL